MLEEIIELKKVSVPDIKRLHEGSRQGIYSIISNKITTEFEMDRDLYKSVPHSETSERSNFGTKFSLRGRGCNILGLEATKRENTDVCIAFMHRKSG